MSTNKLSILGGKKVIKKPLKNYNSIGKEEVFAAQKVVKSGVLSQFLGSWGEGFLGGKFVQNLKEIVKSILR